MTMIRRLLFLFLFFAFVAGARASKETYWRQMLPQTPIPEMLIHLFGQSPSATAEEIIAHNLNVIPNGCPDDGKEKYEAADNQITGTSQNEFFLEKNLIKGMKIDIPESHLSHIEFINREDAEMLPLSTTNLSEILTRFRVIPDSAAAVAINNTLTTCEAPPLGLEKKFCAASIESLLDFVISVLGPHAEVYSSVAERSPTGIEFQIFAKNIVAKDVAVCHKLRYPFALYLCHSSKDTVAYQVDLERATQIVVCHRNTSTWNSRHVAFKVLNVHRGEASICHSTPVDTLVWGPPSKV